MAHRRAVQGAERQPQLLSGNKVGEVEAMNFLNWLVSVLVSDWGIVARLARADVARRCAAEADQLDHSALSWLMAQSDKSHNTAPHTWTHLKKVRGNYPQ